MENFNNDKFIEILYNRCPKRGELANKLTEVLSMERTAIYRRLRGKASFTIEDFFKIASALNISLDEVVAPNEKNINLLSLNYINPSNEELEKIQNIINYFNNSQNFANTEYVEVSNKLPRSLLVNFPYLKKYQLMKWACQYNEEQEILPFSKTVFPAKLSLLASKFFTAMKNISKTTYVLDEKVFENIVRDIEDFYSTGAITAKEKNLIKKDLIGLLDYINKVSVNGYWLETSNEIQFYISRQSIESTYSYFSSSEFKKVRIQAFGRH
jgi:transcriptional regulator with XRE-family HTH domain